MLITVKPFQINGNLVLYFVCNMRLLLVVQNILFLVLSHICLAFRLSNCKSLRCTLELPFPNKRGEILSISMVLHALHVFFFLAFTCHTSIRKIFSILEAEFSGCHVLGYTVGQSTQYQTERTKQILNVDDVIPCLMMVVQLPRQNILTFDRLIVGSSLVVFSVT